MIFGYNLSISSLLSEILPKIGDPKFILFFMNNITFFILRGFPEPTFIISPIDLLLLNINMSKCKWCSSRPNIEDNDIVNNIKLKKRIKDVNKHSEEL